MCWLCSIALSNSNNRFLSVVKIHLCHSVIMRFLCADLFESLHHPARNVALCNVLPNYKQVKSVLELMVIHQ